jgi:hypothetical protein
MGESANLSVDRTMIYCAKIYQPALVAHPLLGDENESFNYYLLC